MSSNVGLSTPRGSGTSGYVQRNLSQLKPRAAGIGAPYTPLSDNNNPSYRPPATRKPDAAILNHDRLREVEIQVLALRDRLEEEDESKNDGGRLGEEVIDERCESLRRKLLVEIDSNGNGNGKVKGGGGPMKRYAVHEMAEAKIRESERLRRALGLRGDEVGGDDQSAGVGGGSEMGNEHPMARQERRKREREEERVRRELVAEGDERYDDGDGEEGGVRVKSERRERYER